MRRVLVCVAALALAPTAAAAPPTVSAHASATAGGAPFTVTLTASGEGTSFAWDFGDGQMATGRTVTHTYTAAGFYTAAVTARVGDQTERATVSVGAFTLEAQPPGGVARFGEPVILRGRLLPAVEDAPVTLVRGGEVVATAPTRPDGTFALEAWPNGPGPYELRWGGVVSTSLALAVAPRISARFVGSRVVGRPLRLEAAIVPAGAGALVVEVWRGKRKTVSATYEGTARVGLSTRKAAPIRIRLAVVPASGWTADERVLQTSVVRLRLGLGSRGSSVRELERRLRELGFAVRGVNGRYGLDTSQAVLAFQKLHGLPWTGRVDGRVWRTLERAVRPRARYGGDHVEVLKRRQVLFLVRGGKVATIVHISTGATGNTPLGHWRVYRKSVGWDWVLWYPMYFLRGFAIHGYPSVPAYPASHGCVRVPMWIAPRLFSQIRHGESIYVY